MIEQILSSDWSGYESKKILQQENPELFAYGNDWECQFLIRRICSMFPQFSEIVVLLAIHKIKRDCHHPCRRAFFVEQVMTDLHRRQMSGLN